jgi:peptidoglycan hydrolase-like protein with peptidoglycan-binding domain
MLGLILSGFLMSAGGVAGSHAATAVWEQFFKNNPDAEREFPRIFTRWLQASLLAIGEDIDVDGEFGPDTERAIKMFQAKEGLEAVDGIAGPKTLDRIAAKLLQKAVEKET